MILNLIAAHQQAIAPLFLGLAALQFGKGLYDSIAGSNDLRKLHEQPSPEFSETPEMKASRLRADEMAKQGFTPQEIAARDQKLIRSENTGATKALNIAPGQSQSILAGLNYVNAGAQNDLASRDAALHRQNISYADKFSQQLQSLSNMNIQAQQRNRIMAEQALGRGIADSRDRMMGAGSTLIAGTAFDKMNPAIPPTQNDPMGWYKNLMKLYGNKTNGVDILLGDQGTNNYT